jgi:uncharacterized protein (UPF0332 family)
MTMAERLLWLAEDMARRGTHSLTAKRRAVSTAYYAVFHAIAALCVREILPDEDRASQEFERVYRSLEHGSLKSEFSKLPLNNNRGLRPIGALVIQLQSERHRSDYLPSRRLYTSETCMQHIQSARHAMKLLGQLSAKDRKILAVALLFRQRSA